MTEIGDTGTIMRTLTKIFRLFLGSFILFGSIFVSTRLTQADFFSSISSIFVGDEVYALQANVSPASISPNNTSDGVDSNTDNISDDAKAFSPNVGPAGVSGEQNPAVDASCGEPNVYVVASGDTIAKVAQLLDVSENTVLAANGMKKVLTKDDVLFIPSVSGVEHTVTKGQTLQKIASIYKVDVNDIIFCNGITSDTPLAIDDQITIPGGQIEQNSNPAKTAPTTKNTKKAKQYNYPAENIAGFINPVPGYRLSQGLHDGNAVDLAVPKGTPIHAAAAGRVIFARMGYNGGFGGLVIISHSNGTQTLYAHQSKIATSAGEQVAQDEVIGYVGSTGHSTGPHLHFEVHGAQNPGANDSWKY